MRGATHNGEKKESTTVSIHAPRARGDIEKELSPTIISVSIHAPRARGDNDDWAISTFMGFNSRPSCEGRRSRACQGILWRAFQFTPLVRGATAGRVISPVHSTFQFTPLVRGATSAKLFRSSLRRFNSRPSCEGRLVSTPKNPTAWFQFTPLVRGATIAKLFRSSLYRFNSRPSCEGRQA